MYRKGAGEVTGHVLNQGAERAINEADTYECVSIFLVTRSSTHAKKDEQLTFSSIFFNPKYSSTTDSSA